MARTKTKQPKNSNFLKRGVVPMETKHQKQLRLIRAEVRSIEYINIYNGIHK